jgi:hypothetical protein
VAAINWLQTITGFVLGLMPLALGRICDVIRFLRAPSRRKYLGVWWVYHRSTSGSGQVYERQWSIQWSWRLGSPRVRTSDAPDGPVGMARLTYVGRLSPRQGMVRYIAMRDPASHERLAWYLLDPFPDPVDRTVGLYLALDMQGLPAAGPMLVSRRRLAADEADRQLGVGVLRAAELACLADIHRSTSIGAVGTGAGP